MLRAKLGAAAEHDRSSSVPDTAGRKHLRRRRGDTETQVFGKGDDSLGQLVFARLEQLLEQANALFDRYLKDVADHPAPKRLAPR